VIAIIIGMRSPTFSTLYIACLRKSCINYTVDKNDRMINKNREFS